MIVESLIINLKEDILNVPPFRMMAYLVLVVSFNFWQNLKLSSTPILMKSFFCKSWMVTYFASAYSTTIKMIMYFFS